MKKVLLVALLAITLTLTGCDQVEDTVTDLQDKITTVTTDLQTAVDAMGELETTITTLQTNLTTAGETITNLESNVVGVNANLEDAEARIEELEAELAQTNNKIKNALNRENWDIRKERYDASWAAYDAEYCFGVFDEDWSTITANDYTHNTGLKFIITIEQVQWGTEIFVKDSCGNYSEFIYSESSYSMYSTPASFFEVGETYEVVLYKEIYFTEYQLGLLPLTDMGEMGAYPTDLSGIVSTKIED
ncbi:Chromosome partition protein Smc [Candidatus Izimaplasma bacterium HR1]|uniref:hypothetical protein n=1 Tax=Candidatus Izimoplasma sp. HR1 TaxID=1541959 RepID=UPI0004F751C5|nr:Chromosome partition protein Smc [Candidatus Izimaplasma bacterium HR1]